MAKRPAIHIVSADGGFAVTTGRARIGEHFDTLDSAKARAAEIQAERGGEVLDLTGWTPGKGMFGISKSGVPLTGGGR